MSARPSSWPRPRWPLTEEFVFDTQQSLALDNEVTTPRKAHLITAGRPVEGLRDRRTPVDHDRFTVLVGNRQTADVECLGLIR